jgi:hypothetical protein
MNIICVMLSVDVETIKLGYGLIVLGFDSQQGQEIFLFSKTSTQALGPTQCFIP